MNRPRRTGPCTARRHNTALAYMVDRCACPPAREAYRLYYKRLREGRQPSAYIDVTGTRRRLEALATLGWTVAALAQHAGLRKTLLDDWRRATYPRIRRDHHDRIAALYRELCDREGPSASARIRARKAGLPGPTAWDTHTIDDPHARPDTGDTTPADVAPVDPIAVEQLVAGRAHPDRHDRATVNAAIDTLDRRGWTTQAIADHLHVPRRRAERRRAARRTTQPGKAA